MNFGSSLVVPSVQELVRENITEIPHRYIRTSSSLHNHEDHHCDTNYTIPIISIQNLLSEESILAHSELNKLHSACKDWGFFQVLYTY